MKFVVAFIFLITANYVHAQQTIIVQGKYPQLYFFYTVKKTEQLSAIAKTYQVSEFILAKQNKLKPKQTVSTNKKLKIPLNNNNFNQKNLVPNNNLIPVCYVVHKKETLLTISKKNGNVNLSLLKKWNRLKSNVIKPSQKLIIGYLLLNIINKLSTETTINTNNNNFIETNNLLATPTPIDSNFINTVIDTTNNIEDEGFFIDSFPLSNSLQQSIIVEGDASVFKSTSGWKDKKYYVLLNDVPFGTIVRITNPDNARSVCAKVIGNLPKIKSNNNILLRITTATAYALKLNNTKFLLSLVYFKRN